MSDIDRAHRAHDAGDGKAAEPPSSSASALARGQSLWNRFKSLLALRTVSLRDDLQVALEEEGSAETADFTENERTILQNVLKLGNVRVEDVMVERSDIQAVDVNITLGGLIARFRDVGHSRLPVYEENLDNILGFIHVKDALRKITEPVSGEEVSTPVKLVSSALKQKVLKLDIMRTAVFVPPSTPVGDLLQSMRASRIHMAIVVDEYGGTDGLVTIEDLLEAVVGEIEDEHDDLQQSLIRKVGADTYLADARAELEEVRELLGPDFDPGEYAEDIDTVGGLVFAMAGHVPQKGEVVTSLPNFEFEILAADSRRVKRLRIRRAKPVAPAALPLAPPDPDDQATAAE
jgi:CBS domain containing-hemolysin-like protein